MKTQQRFRQAAAVAGLAMAYFAASIHAQDLVIATFDHDQGVYDDFIGEEVHPFVANAWQWWGGATQQWEWDRNVDADGRADSGSMKFTITLSGSGDNQYAIGMSLSGLGNYHSGVTVTPIEYSHLAFDVLWDTDSTFPLDTFNNSGDPQGFGIGLATTSWGQTWVPNPISPRLEGQGQWERVMVPLDPVWPSSAGLIFKKWLQANAANAGTITFWVDNITFLYNPDPDIPPPTLSLRQSQPGLHLFASHPTSQWQRQGIRSLAADFTQWYGNPEPVTYSMTISEFPGTEYPGFQAHIFLVPDTGGGTAPDWSDPHAIFVEIQRTGDGQGQATFRYKVSQPDGNSMLWNEGNLGTLVAPTVTGTWSVTFRNDNEVTLEGPGGGSLELTIPESDAAWFYSTLSIMGTYFGIQPNQLANIGQWATISRIQVTSGETVIVDDTFEFADPWQEVDMNRWILRLESEAGIRVVDSFPAYWLSWTLPDAGFSLRTSQTIGSPSPWYDLTLEPVTMGSLKRVLLEPLMLPSEEQGYFQLVQPE